MGPPRSCPPILTIALSFLTQLIYRTYMLSKEKTVEIRLWEFEWKSPFIRVSNVFTHVVFRMVKSLRKGRGKTNIMATLGRTLGPFGTAREAYDAADKAGLKLGLTLEELQVYMTLERKIRKGPRKGTVETRIVPVFQLLVVNEIRRGVAQRGEARRRGQRGGSGGAVCVACCVCGDTWCRLVAWRGATEAWRGVAWHGVAPLKRCVA
jgi:hypothetical protein